MKTYYDIANEIFTEKSYEQENKDLYHISIAVRWLCGAFSVVAGVNFLNERFSNFLPLYLSYFFALCALLLMEYLKDVLTKKAVKKQLLHLKTSFVLFGAALAIYASSAAVSLFGIITYYDSQDPTIKTAKSSQAAELQRVAAHFDSLAAAEKKEYSQYTSAVSWNGKFDISNRANKQRTDLHAARLKQIYQEKESSLTTLKQESTEILSNVKNGVQESRTSWLLICAASEAVILVCLIYSYSFFWNLKKEIASTRRVTLRAPKIIEHLADVQPIGFNSLVKQDQDKTRTRARTREEQQQVEHLRADILNGTRQDVLCKKYRLNPEQVRDWANYFRQENENFNL